SANSGTITTPPPSPVSEPRNPAKNEQSRMSRVNSRIFNLDLLRARLRNGQKALPHKRPPPKVINQQSTYRTVYWFGITILHRHIHSSKWRSHKVPAAQNGFACVPIFRKGRTRMTPLYSRQES